jgi:hypothetical protein
MSGARIRLDIAGYTERRREALRIYTRRLAEKVLAEGGEVMLEPMNAADRGGTRHSGRDRRRPLTRRVKSPAVGGIAKEDSD